jgi:hypothetical protein
MWVYAEVSRQSSGQVVRKGRDGEWGKECLGETGRRRNEETKKWQQ